MLSRPNEDLLILVAAGVVAGPASILIRFAGTTDFLTIAFYRLAIASAAVLFFGTLLRRIRFQNRAGFLLLALSGVFLGLHFVAFTYAVQFTSVSNATFLGDLGPVFVAAFHPSCCMRGSLRVKFSSS